MNRMNDTVSPARHVSFHWDGEQLFITTSRTQLVIRGADLLALADLFSRHKVEIPCQVQGLLAWVREEHQQYLKPTMTRAATRLVRPAYMFCNAQQFWAATGKSLKLAELWSALFLPDTTCSIGENNASSSNFGKRDVIRSRTLHSLSAKRCKLCYRA